MESNETLKELGRKVRSGPLEKLGVPTWTLVVEALERGDIQQGLEIINYARFETQQRHDSFARLLSYALDFVAQNYGEEQIGELWRAIGKRHMPSIPVYQPLLPEARVREIAEVQRGHSCGRTGLGDLTIREEADRYVLTLNPCGTGGRLRMDDTYGRTQKAYPWSWNQKGVPYFCTHCCVQGEILAIEEYGYHMGVYEGGNWRDDPCIRYIYKSPELIPEKYFIRVGKTKRLERFKSSKT